MKYPDIRDIKPGQCFKPVKFKTNYIWSNITSFLMYEQSIDNKSIVAWVCTPRETIKRIKVGKTKMVKIDNRLFNKDNTIQIEVDEFWQRDLIEIIFENGISKDSLDIPIRIR